MKANEKANRIFGEIRSNYPRRVVLEPTISGMKEVNLECAKIAILAVDVIIKELSWWQVSKKFFYMAVKMELFTLRWAILNDKSFDI